MSKEQLPPLSESLVFEPIRVGKKTLSNRVVYCPTTRFRAAKGDPKSRHVPSDLMQQYYYDRAQYPGTLLITEATLVSERSGGYEGVPKISTREEVDGWKKIINKVHERGSLISCQFWFLGRVADPKVLKARGLDMLAPSPVHESPESQARAEKQGIQIRAVSEEEIKDIIFHDYEIAAKNAIEAGFDYIELHGAHGYFIDQFLHECSNKRTDKYGGSIENRCRFALELIDHLSNVIGADKLAIRLSPWAEVQGIEERTSPIPTFSYLLDQLQRRADAGKQLAYVSVVEPRVQGTVTVDASSAKGDNHFVEQVWKGVIIRAGNYTYDAPEFKSIREDTANGRTLVGFSRYFTSNPDLVSKLKNDPTNLVKYNRATFYGVSNWGYNTYVSHGTDSQFDEEVEKKRYPKLITERSSEANL
ncbi:putative NADPH dehydrogenase [Spathaspora sp. JA1]|nr:putative NADPH dehydrogenase [Spathaspora sp. JA1]